MEKYSMTNREVAVHVRSSLAAQLIISQIGGKGYCSMFDEMYHSYINPPQRCQKLFNKAFRMPDGSKLVIVINEKTERINE